MECELCSRILKPNAEYWLDDILVCSECYREEVDREKNGLREDDRIR